MAKLYGIGYVTKVAIEIQWSRDYVLDGDLEGTVKGNYNFVL